jgi:hypothetical protein
MSEKYEHLEEILEAMLLDNEKMTIRAVIARSGGLFKHTTDLTRDRELRERLRSYSARQHTIRASVDKTSKTSRSELQRLVAAKNSEIDELRSKIEVLVASHRAAIRAISSMGGFNIWKEFFEKHRASFDALKRMGALPSAEVVPHDRSVGPNE